MCYNKFKMLNKLFLLGAILAAVFAAVLLSGSSTAQVQSPPPSLVLFDFGDAPASYPTKLAQNGMRHPKPVPEAAYAAPSPWLGEKISYESDAKPVDDYDDGASGINKVKVTTPAGWTSGQTVYLNILIDYNDDDDWADGAQAVPQQEEWVVKNYQLMPPSSAAQDMTTAYNIPGLNFENFKHWTRVTLTTSKNPCVGLPWAGHLFLDQNCQNYFTTIGETEDYYKKPGFLSGLVKNIGKVLGIGKPKTDWSGLFEPLANSIEEVLDMPPGSLPFAPGSGPSPENPLASFGATVAFNPMLPVIIMPGSSVELPPDTDPYIVKSPFEFTVSLASSNISKIDSRNNLLAQVRNGAPTINDQREMPESSSDSRETPKASEANLNVGITSFALNGRGEAVSVARGSADIFLTQNQPTTKIRVNVPTNVLSYTQDINGNNLLALKIQITSDVSALVNVSMSNLVVNATFNSLSNLAHFLANYQFDSLMAVAPPNPHRERKADELRTIAQALVDAAKERNDYQPVREGVGTIAGEVSAEIISANGIRAIAVALAQAFRYVLDTGMRNGTLPGTTSTFLQTVFNTWHGSSEPGGGGTSDGGLASGTLQGKINDAQRLLDRTPRGQPISQDDFDALSTEEQLSYRRNSTNGTYNKMSVADQYRQALINFNSAAQRNANNPDADLSAENAALIAAIRRALELVLPILR